jgi:hypothetical protein
MDFESGDRVMTPHGLGTVVFKRMAPPHFLDAGSYSIRLDSQDKRPGYTGSSYPAKDVKKAPEQT